MAAKLFGLEGSTVRRIVKLFALDGSTPRRVKKLFSLDGSTVRLIFEDFSTFTISGTANQIVSPVNEIVDFGVRSDFNAGGADVSVNASATGDASNVGGVTGLSVDVDSSHTYTGASPFASYVGISVFTSSGVKFGRPTGLSGSLQSQYLQFYAMCVAVGGIRSSNVQFIHNGFGTGTTYNFSQIPSGSDSGVTVNSSGHQVRLRNNFNTDSFSSGGNNIAFLGSFFPVSVRFIGLTTSLTGRRARIVNGSNRAFTITGGGLTAGGNFATGSLAAGASTAFITANSTSEAWTLTGVVTKAPATFTIANADNSISVSGTFGDDENATQARDRIQSVLNANSTFQGKFNTGVDADKTISGVAHKVVTFTSDSAENTSDFSISVTGNDGSNTTPYEATTTQGATQSLQTTVQVTRAVEGSSVSSTKAISSQANIDTAGAEVATLGGDITYDSSTNKLKVQDVDATINVSNAGSLAFNKD